MIFDEFLIIIAVSIYNSLSSFLIKNHIFVVFLNFVRGFAYFINDRKQVYLRPLEFDLYKKITTAGIKFNQLFIFINIKSQYLEFNRLKLSIYYRYSSFKIIIISI